MKEPKEKRQHIRFSDLTLLYVPIRVLPLPPYFSDELQGNLINLSANGMAFQISKEIPIQTRLKLNLSLPDRSLLEAVSKVTRVVKQDSKTIMGVRFLNIPGYMENKIGRMAVDYNKCEDRIQQKAATICRPDCSFFNICNKPEKKESEDFMKQKMELTLRMIKQQS